MEFLQKQARKPRSYASPKLRLTDSLTHLLTGVKCRATSVAKNRKYVYPENNLLESLHIKFQYLAQRVKRSFGKRPAFGTFLKQSNQKSL